MFCCILYTVYNIQRLYVYYEKQIVVIKLLKAGIVMRNERDFIGDMEVSETVYYGIQTLRALDNFSITGQSLDSEFIIALAIVKKAAALANMKTGRLDLQIGNGIVEAATEIINGTWHEQFVVDPIQGGAGTSINMNTNEVIANRVLELLGHQKGEYSIVSPNNHVNMAQSTNDVMPTAIRIATISKAKKLVEVLRAAVEAFHKKADEFSGVLKVGRTHLQDAVPIRLGQEFEAYAAVLGRSAGRIEKAMQDLLTINMGATAVGTGLNAEPEYIKKVVQEIACLTGEKFITCANLIDGTQNTDVLAEFSGSLKVCCLALSKICNDLRLMASGPKCGLNEIYLEPRQPGSSIMPGKVNPVIPEVVNQVCFQVIGNDVTIALAVEAGQLELNVMEPVIAFNLFNSLSMLTKALTVFRAKCITSITANAERCNALVDGSVGIVTALAPYIGYEQSAKVAKEAIETGKLVQQIVLDKGLLKAEELMIILSPENMTQPGIVGSTKLQHAV
ncbi:MAG: Aspartate ammonia-lyase [Firmicutes bacterium]|nr:Aspartate ammonia-lyase [Bacillota bacterium]